MHPIVLHAISTANSARSDFILNLRTKREFVRLRNQLEISKRSAPKTMVTVASIIILGPISLTFP